MRQQNPLTTRLKQIQALTEVERLLESLRGEEAQRVTGQTGQTPARTHKGKTPVGEVHSCPLDIPNPQTQGSIVWEPVSIIPKVRVRMCKARRPVLDEGARMHPDPWPSLGVVIINPDTCITPFRCHSTPLHVRIRHVEKALPPSGAPPKTAAPNSGSRWTCILKSWRNQGERQYQATHLSLEIMAALETSTILGPHARSQTWTRRESNVRTLMRMNKGEHCRSWALHQPWPKEPLASDLLARLRQPPPLSPRRWSSGRKTKPRAKSRRPCEKARESSMRCHRRVRAWPSQRRHRVRPTAKSRHRREGARTNCAEALPPEHKCERGATLQSTAERKVESLPREGKHEADEPPPEALPQKGERNPEALPCTCKRKLERPEAPPQRGRCEPEALPPDSERKRGMTL